MKILRTFAELSLLKKPTVCALGTFDGVHRGHRAVIQAALERATQIGATPVVVTFDRHPFSLLKPAEVPTLLCSREEKFKIIEELGVEVVLELSLTEDLLAMEDREFMQVLSETAKTVCIGENFTFGADGKGNVKNLYLYGQEMDFEVIVTPMQYLDDGATLISSSAIRQAVEQGRMEDVQRMLARPYSIEATVIEGDRRGRLLGFPTANFLIPDELTVPCDGVYVTSAILDGTVYQSVGNVGDNPTFENQYHRLEVHILDFNRDIYGKKMKIEFLSFIRGEEKFSSLDALISQMHLDLDVCRAYFKR